MNEQTNLPNNPEVGMSPFDKRKQSSETESKDLPKITQLAYTRIISGLHSPIGKIEAITPHPKRSRGLSHTLPEIHPGHLALGLQSCQVSVLLVIKMVLATLPKAKNPALFASFLGLLRETSRMRGDLLWEVRPKTLNLSGSFASRPDPGSALKAPLM